jgi:hypothetical protein
MKIDFLLEFSDEEKNLKYIIQTKSRILESVKKGIRIRDLFQKVFVHLPFFNYFNCRKKLTPKFMSPPEFPQDEKRSQELGAKLNI